MILTVALIFWMSAALYPVAAQDALPENSAVAMRLRRGLAESAAAIDLSDCALLPTQLGRLYVGVLQDDPSLFYVAPRLSYSMQGDRVAVVYPTYTLEGAALEEARGFFRATLAARLSEMEAVFDSAAPTEAETALLVHELLAAHYDYDTRALTAGGGHVNAYGFFRDGIGVCQAYAMAAIALLRGAGMEADLVTSAAMDHAWVHVRVGGAWYHMDITRDDPVAVRPDGTSASAGLVTHTHVLRSDEGMRALGYSGYTCAGGHICSDNRYESPAILAALGELTVPLRAISAGRGNPLMWVGERADGALLPLRLSDGGVTVYAPGDMDGDGGVTPADLLLLSSENYPEAWRIWMRKRVVEVYSATRMDISPECRDDIPSAVSTSRE